MKLVLKLDDLKTIKKKIRLLQYIFIHPFVIFNFASFFFFFSFLYAFFSKNCRIRF